MLGRDYGGQTCSIARTLEVIGERWTMLIVRDVFLGLRRFDDIQADLGIARNVLAGRLERLVETGVLAKVSYQEHPPRHEYRLTDKGRDLWPVMVELMQWGDRHAPGPDGPPVVYRHRGCGGALASGRVCDVCGAVVERPEVAVEAGPGAPPGHPIHRYVAGAA
jgi:DNA-binding HxlR family transcriptional regulator